MRILTAIIFILLTSISFISKADTASWKKCPSTWELDPEDKKSMQCTYVKSSIDHNNAKENHFVKLAVAKLPAIASKKGTIILISGGPGQMGLPLSIDESPITKDLRKYFDIVTYDPRGIGESIPKIKCNTQKSTDKNEEITSKKWLSSCIKNSGAALINNMSTYNAVDDLEEIRKALNEDKITIVAYSYGTAVAQLYALKYPKHISSIVNDGIVDLTEDHESMLLNQSRGFNLAFEKFSVYCAKRKSCPFYHSPEKPLDIYKEILEKANKNKIKDKAGKIITNDNINEFTLDSLLWESQWGNLISFLDKAYNGKTNQIDKGSLSIFGDSSNDELNIIDCSDYGKLDPSKIELLLEDTFASSADFFKEKKEKCSSFPIKKPLMPALIPDHKNMPKLLFVAQTGDPTTPYSNATRMSAIFRSPLITKIGNGHTFVLNGDDDCVDKKVVKFILNPNLPISDSYCLPTHNY
ncbi:alpha/beta fold hydrolase [Xenorhabdus anantnagensis]|uniref:Proline iminopeptidase n=1 Tax=Xenorhabdus anantnagensis TaxID=3025875 RepID=A0ABT5LUG1_9GAMM|nr:alpha/beta fold hydrolase [Xenorhabdus anantnagensis]MDC9598052.1 alpha/beta fold hydrolase [Xenorhabdus anantnagensis]